MKTEPKSDAPAITVGSKVTHRNAAEKAGEVIALKADMARVRYNHATEIPLAGKPGQFEQTHTFADYAVAELTIVT